MKPVEEIMQILEAYDLCGSYRWAADLARCSHDRAERYVALGDLGEDPEARKRMVQAVDPCLGKVEEWVERSHGKIRADVCHDRLKPLGYGASERTTRRAVAEVKGAYRKGQRRVYRPWVPEPGMWFQWDWAQGPRAGSRGTELFCAWLAWSRYRVVLLAWDSTYPTLVSCLDATSRAFARVPTYGLTDNEKTVMAQPPGQNVVMPAYYDTATKLLRSKDHSHVGAITYGIGVLGQQEFR